MNLDQLRQQAEAAHSGLQSSLFTVGAMGSLELPLGRYE